ncbi:MAG TPA: c-type cytochrome [Blastocatellia bacterium]|nr:c-type cytochrome [Blastocatellia bacterium]
MCLRNSLTGRLRLSALVVFLAAASGLMMEALIVEAQGPRRNAEAQKIKNPVAGDAESVEAGKKLYQRHCASCHGPQGKGDGGMALSGGTPSDLTDDTWDYGSTDGEIFVSIRDGVSSDMLAYKDKLDEKQIWQVVNFIRSIGPKSNDAK